MEKKDMQKFLDTYFKKWNETYKTQSKEMQASLILMKIMTKTGKLSREVARAFGLVSRKHLEKPSKLDSELAGVIIYTKLLAKSLNVDIDEAIASKMKRMEENINNKDYEAEGGMCEQAGCGCRE
ncbi:MAG: MazG-like family protein [Alphaproteobacteria bacterium]